jgi:hypothetical protein
MEIALIISLIALAVALPGCIADSLTVIEKMRSRKDSKSDSIYKKTTINQLVRKVKKLTKMPAHATLDSLKKVIRNGHDHAEREPLQHRCLSTRRQSSLKKAFIRELTPFGA